jgi:hypothetical protein
MKHKKTTKHYRNAKKIIIVPDASVHQPKAAWAWVASDKEGNIIKQQSSRI